MRSDILLRLHAILQPAADLMRVRSLAQRWFRRLLTWRYGDNGLASTWQNGRYWQLDPEVALRGSVQEFETIEWLRGVIETGMCVVDVGANVGQMTLEMAHLVGPAGKVIAIEPAPGNVTLLRKHVTANEFQDRVEIVEAACADKEGEMDFVIHASREDAVGSGHQVLSVSSHGVAGTETARKIVKVRVVSLDGLCERLGVQPNVLKIDVEGAEALVLQGARKVLAACRPCTRMGFHPFAFDHPAREAASIRDVFLACGMQLVGNSPPENWGLEEYVFATRENEPGS